MDLSGEKIILDLLNSNWVSSSLWLMSQEVESCVYSLDDQKLQKIKVAKVSVLLEFKKNVNISWIYL